VDAKTKFWKAAIKNQNTPHTPGLDVCGFVHMVGESAPESSTEGFKEGDLVVYHGRMFEPHGGCAQYAVHEAITCLKIPTNCRLSTSQLSAIPCAAWTAYKIIRDKCFVVPQDSVLLYGASGGVGSFALFYLKSMKVREIIAVCSGKNVDYVRLSGAHFAIDYEKQVVKDEVLRITGGIGVNKAIDLVGPETAAVCADCLAYDGIVCAGVSNVEPQKTHDQFSRGLSFAQVTLGGAHLQSIGAKQALFELGKQATQLIVESDYFVPITKEISLVEVPFVLEEMLKAHNTGKIVVRVEDEQKVVNP